MCGPWRDPLEALEESGGGGASEERSPQKRGDYGVLVRFQPFYLRIPSDMNRKFKVPETASEFSGEKNNKTQAHPHILS